ncbi:hypothetical protein [Rhodocyclus purpureus]|uniref:hypothetical protein n=1 Tax=Rhodocyclus purpureus TaxID=1067 RepID=UPI001913C7B7|nr:hypothetical protein [Rhodocyclus purpureus]MBK5913076.1 hypothetical protein [Rhodocyclus purpureus]
MEQFREASAELICRSRRDQQQSVIASPKSVAIQFVGQFQIHSRLSGTPPVQKNELDCHGATRLAMTERMAHVQGWHDSP